jgi:hypothetical protein
MINFNNILYISASLSLSLSIMPSCYNFNAILISPRMLKRLPIISHPNNKGEEPKLLHSFLHRTSASP